MRKHRRIILRNLAGIALLASAGIGLSACAYQGGDGYGAVGYGATYGSEPGYNYGYGYGYGYDYANPYYGSPYYAPSYGLFGGPDRDYGGYHHDWHGGGDWHGGPRALPPPPHHGGFHGAPPRGGSFHGSFHPPPHTPPHGGSFHRGFHGAPLARPPGGHDRNPDHH